MQLLCKIFETALCGTLAGKILKMFVKLFFAKFEKKAILHETHKRSDNQIFLKQLKNLQIF